MTQPPSVLSAKLNELAGFRAELTLLGSLHAGMRRLRDETNLMKGTTLALDHPHLDRKHAVLSARRDYRQRGCLDIRMEPKWSGLRKKADIDLEHMRRGEETFQNSVCVSISRSQYTGENGSSLRADGPV